MSTQIWNESDYARVEANDHECGDVITQQCHHQADSPFPLLRDALAVIFCHVGVLQWSNYPITREKAEDHAHPHADRDRAQYDIECSQSLSICRFGHVISVPIFDGKCGLTAQPCRLIGAVPRRGTLYSAIRGLPRAAPKRSQILAAQATPGISLRDWLRVRSSPL